MFELGFGFDSSQLFAKQNAGLLALLGRRLIVRASRMMDGDLMVQIYNGVWGNGFCLKTQIESEKESENMVPVDRDLPSGIL